MPTLDEETRLCIRDCMACHAACHEAMADGLETGGRHAAAEHILVLLDCAEFCRLTGEMMLRGSRFHRQVCILCADVCARCAESCRSFGDDARMRACANLCDRCAVTLAGLAG